MSICVPTYGHIYVSINKSLTLMLSVNQAIFLSTPTSLSDLSMKSKFIYQQPANQPINGTHYSATQPVNQTANQTSNQSVNQSVNQPINQPINPSSCLFTHPCIGLSVIYQSIHLCIYLPIYLSFCQPLHVDSFYLCCVWQCSLPVCAGGLGTVPPTSIHQPLSRVQSYQNVKVGGSEISLESTGLSHRTGHDLHVASCHRT